MLYKASQSIWNTHSIYEPSPGYIMPSWDRPLFHIGALWGKRRSFIFKKVKVKKNWSELKPKRKTEDVFQNVQVAGTSSHITGKSFWILNTFKSKKKGKFSFCSVSRLLLQQLLALSWMSPCWVGSKRTAPPSAALEGCQRGPPRQKAAEVAAASKNAGKSFLIF